MKKLQIIASFIILIGLFASCTQKEPAKIEKKKDSTATVPKVEKKSFNKNDFEFENENIITVAKPIFYTAIIKNSKSEQEYMNEWLKGMKKEQFVNMIFDEVYNGKLIAENFNNNENMTVEQVKEFEKENKRAEIGQIFFEEDWYFDKEKLQMYKKVKSIMLAYEIYNEGNGITGRYRAGIKVYLK